MQKRKNLFGIDSFRIIAALLVVAIHTSPLQSFSADADFFLTRVLARIAVPFFFMVTGHFILPDAVSGGGVPTERIGNYLKKIFLYYGAAVLIYLPIGDYAGLYEGLSLTGMIRMLLVDGTFYHLWYFPALITGVLIVCLLSRFLKTKGIFAVCGVLYIIGLFGDSYFGLIKEVPVLSNLYEFGFRISSYTRNGLFYAPLFLVLGAAAAKRTSRIRFSYALVGFLLSFCVMTAEAFTLHIFDLQRHDSMYLALVLVMFFLYELILLKNQTAYPACRNTATLIYILHPAFIVVVRGAAKVLHMAPLLVDNSLIHYLAVAFSSAAAAFVITMITAFLQKKYPGLAKSSRSGAKASSAFPRGRAWIELDQKALQQNVISLRELLPEDCKLMPAVKANAYGHGLLPVSKKLNEYGVDAFCVASASEGAALRKGGIKGEILVLGYTHSEDFPLLCRYSLIQTVLDYTYALRLNGYGKKIHVHIGIDTGMHRLGERSENVDRICRIYKMKNLVIDGLYTHLCVSDSKKPQDVEYTKLQADRFYEAVRELEKRGFSCPNLHLQSSYGIFYYPDLAESYARVGIALYGVLSTKEDTLEWKEKLLPVLSLKARIAAVKDLYAGESAGYGMQFTADCDMQIAALSIGYADGLPRSLSNGKSFCLINGCRAPIIGRICMDQTLVDVSGIPEVHTGDTAVFIGKSGKLTVSACDLAEWTGTITNEILSRMGERLERIMM